VVRKVLQESVVCHEGVVSGGLFVRLGAAKVPYGLEIFANGTLIGALLGGVSGLSVDRHVDNRIHFFPAKGQKSIPLQEFLEVAFGRKI
jgi:hypothetical protein